MKRQETPHKSRLARLYTSGMELKEWVRKARQHAKLTQEQLGERLGVTKGNISGWENGRHSPGFKQVLKIEEITGWQFEADAPDAPAPDIPLADALAVIDKCAQRASSQARAELQKAFDLYLTDPRRYSKLLEDIADLLATPAEPPPGEAPDS